MGRETTADTAHLRCCIEEDTLVIVEDEFTESIDNGYVHRTIQCIFPMDS